MNHFEISGFIPRGTFITLEDNRLKFTFVFNESDRIPSHTVRIPMYVEALVPATDLMKFLAISFNEASRAMLQHDFQARVQGRITQREFLMGEHDPVIETIFLVEDFVLP